MTLLLVLAAVSTTLLVPTLGLNVFALWNLVPLAAAAALLWLRGRGSIRSARALRASLWFCVASLGVVLGCHIGWWVWWGDSESSTAGLLFVALPVYALVAGALSAFISLLPVVHLRRSRRAA
jgi:hypothetical protein